MSENAATPRTEIDSSVFNPFSPEFVRAPHDTWQRMLRDYPIAWHKELQMWVVNTHELCSAILKNNVFTPNFRMWEHAPPEKPEAEKNDFDKAFDHSLFTVSQKQHLKLRKLTMPAFSKPVMGRIHGKIEDLVTECFDDIGDAEEFDVYDAIANKLPVRAIARMVGVPTDREAFFHDFAVNLIMATRPNLSPKQRDAAIEGTLPGFAFFRELIDERRARDEPGDDFLGSLVGASEDGESLDDYDILAVIFALIAAGSDTATDLHTYAIKGLLEHPDQMQKLRDNPDLMENAIIELLRHGSMGKLPFFRFASEDVDFGGERIGKGQCILVNLSAAWHDPARYPDWDQLDIERRLDGNLVFGAGAHFCIGTYLVRVQGGLMISEFLKRFPDAELANGDGDIDYDYAHHNARRINRLHVRTHQNAARQAA
ncbi:cytochrome P450 [Algiphilus sp.]|uniref:cytochrome P450 n=1 Tax=Algiphilus sp. TaxID=1872431 RepID=UPI0025BA6D6B|nr:cytochrome P450 [Algiphilus sp.]MCK5769732.1 cytochrome P450 [Algiphilus sp.]